MICEYCERNLGSLDYIEHIEKFHPEVLNIYYEKSTNINVDKSLAEEEIALKESGDKYAFKSFSNNTKWEPDNFELEATSVWQFRKRGNWATHNSKYRGNWSPYIPRNIILRYSKENEIVLDPFLGGGTTLIETKLLKRYGIGVDINPKSIELAEENLAFSKNQKYHPRIINGDSRNLNMLKNESIDLICGHPPYANIIKYSDGIKGDMSLLDIEEFLISINEIAKECYRLLKPNKYCCILIGDTRKNKHVVPLGFRVMEEFLKEGFVLKENIIKEQHNCKASGFWFKKSIKYNFLLLAHEYLFVFRKPLNSR